MKKRSESNQNHSKPHNSIITTSELVSRNFPGDTSLGSFSAWMHLADFGFRKCWQNTVHVDKMCLNHEFGCEYSLFRCIQLYSEVLQLHYNHNFTKYFILVQFSISPYWHGGQKRHKMCQFHWLFLGQSPSLNQAALACMFLHFSLGISSHSNSLDLFLLV